MLYIGMILALTGVCLWLHWRQVSPARFYAAAAATFFIYGAILFWPAYFPQSAQSLNPFPPSTNPVFSSNTHYVVRYFWAVMMSGMVFLVVSLLIWGQQRLGAMLYPGLTRWLLWPLLISTLHVPAYINIMIEIPRRNIAASERIGKLFDLSAQVAQMAFLCLLALTLGSFLKCYIFARSNRPQI